MNTDQIIILEDGRVHAVGTHESLLASDPIYQEIYASQMKGGDGGPAARRKSLKTCGTPCAPSCPIWGRHKLLLLAVAVLVTISALANLLGTYMIRPVVNSLAPGPFPTWWGVAVTAGSTPWGPVPWATPRSWCGPPRRSCDIRRDLFAHLQTLPLQFFDSHRHGDVMSYFTNDWTPSPTR